MTLTIRKLFLALMFVLALSSCGEDPFVKRDPERGVDVGPDWKVKDVRVRCADGELCPDGSGALMVIHRSTVDRGWYTSKKVSLERCTGSIYGLYRGLTAGHCLEDFAGASEIWFKTAEKPGRPSRTFHVHRRPLAKEFSPDFWSADYGAFELVEPATGIQFSHPPANVPPDTREMVALVINAESADSIGANLVLSAVKCSHGREDLDPITYEMNPSKFVLTACKLVSGNSGGAVVLAREPNAILGIVSASNQIQPRLDTDGIVAAFRAKLNPPPKRSYAIATNARCLSVPGWPRTEKSCIEMNEATLKAAVQDAERARVASALRRRISAWLDSSLSRASLGGLDVRFVPEPVPLTYSDRFDHAEERRGYALMPIPHCILKSELIGKEATVKLEVLPYGDAVEEARLTPVTLTLHLTLAGAGLYLARFDSLEDKAGVYRYAWMPVEASVYRKLFGEGQILEMNACSGNEKSEYLSLFDKEGSTIR